MITIIIILIVSIIVMLQLILLRVEEDIIKEVDIHMEIIMLILLKYIKNKIEKMIPIYLFFINEKAYATKM